MRLTILACVLQPIAGSADVIACSCFGEPERLAELAVPGRVIMRGRVQSRTPGVMTLGEVDLFFPATWSNSATIATIHRGNPTACEVSWLGDEFGPGTEWIFVTYPGFEGHGLVLGTCGSFNYAAVVDGYVVVPDGDKLVRTTPDSLARYFDDWSPFRSRVPIFAWTLQALFAGVSTEQLIGFGVDVRTIGPVWVSSAVSLGMSTPAAVARAGLALREVNAWGAWFYFAADTLLVLRSDLLQFSANASIGVRREVSRRIDVLGRVSAEFDGSDADVGLSFGLGVWRVELLATTHFVSTRTSIDMTILLASF